MDKEEKRRQGRYPVVFTLALAPAFFSSLGFSGRTDARTHHASARPASSFTKAPAPTQLQAAANSEPWMAVRLRQWLPSPRKSWISTPDRGQSLGRISLFDIIHTIYLHLNE